ncbi:MAG: lycopene cyclase family protein, partial [Ilumatobacteraceae bacterium]
MTGSHADVVVVGDGPAGTALAAACVARGVDVVLIGRDESWAATYSVWTDELEDVPYATTLGSVMAYGARPHRIDREYGILDNQQLRGRLRAGVPFVAGEVVGVKTGLTHHTLKLSTERLTCRLVVDATGWPPKLAPTARSRTAPAWQTAFGVVLPEPPDGELGAPTLMDFRPAPVGGGVPDDQPTFAYALAVTDGWLVEETVLAARPAIEPDRLVARLAARLGTVPERLLDVAVRTERVRIPMGGPAAARDQPVVAFGAAAGYVNPATGYSVAASRRAAARVAEAAETALGAPADLAADWRTVW